jgi:hypothetical protein
VQKAGRPFQFLTASYLIRIQNLKATTLAELGEGLEGSSDASIFYHTFQSLSRHHFLTQGFSSDFAQWVLAACNRAELAEQLANLDIREYTALAELRTDLRCIVRDYCERHPPFATQEAFEAFSFCEALETLSRASLHYHFIASRLRLHLQTNDFSYWLENSLDLPALARRINRVDIYTNTLEGVSAVLTNLIREELG